MISPLTPLQKTRISYFDVDDDDEVLSLKDVREAYMSPKMVIVCKRNNLQTGGKAICRGESIQIFQVILHYI
jgi:hypothetical protein